MPNQLPLPLTYYDSIVLRAGIEAAVDQAIVLAETWRTYAPEGPALTHLEQDVVGADGVARREKIPLKRSGRQPPHVDGPRYERSMIDAELAQILYRAAVRLGLYSTGAESVLLRALTRAEEELATMRGHPDPRAAAVLAVGALALEAVTK